MRKITCQSCLNRYGDHGLWIVFNNTIICESCKLAVIEYFRVEFDLGHPFVQEFLLMDRSTRK